MNVTRVVLVVARILAVRCEVVGLSDADPVVDVVDLAAIVQELEVISGLLVGNSVFRLSDGLSNDTTGTLFREPAAVVVIALLNGPPEWWRARRAGGGRRRSIPLV